MMRCCFLPLSVQSLTVSRKKLVHYTSHDQKKRASDAVLIGGFAVNIWSLSQLLLQSPLLGMNSTRRPLADHLFETKPRGSLQDAHLRKQRWLPAIQVRPHAETHRTFLCILHSGWWTAGAHYTKWDLFYIYCK